MILVRPFIANITVSSTRMMAAAYGQYYERAIPIAGLVEVVLADRCTAAHVCCGPKVDVELDPRISQHVGPGQRIARRQDRYLVTAP